MSDPKTVPCSGIIVNRPLLRPDHQVAVEVVLEVVFEAVSRGF